jgi:hypothetical protein
MYFLAPLLEELAGDRMRSRSAFCSREGAHRVCAVAFSKRFFFGPCRSNRFVIDDADRFMMHDVISAILDTFESISKRYSFFLSWLYDVQTLTHY